jgi:hypothetical protein
MWRQALRDGRLGKVFITLSNTLPPRLDRATRLQLKLSVVTLDVTSGVAEPFADRVDEVVDPCVNIRRRILGVLDGEQHVGSVDPSSGSIEREAARPQLEHRGLAGERDVDDDAITGELAGEVRVRVAEVTAGIAGNVDHRVLDRFAPDVADHDLRGSEREMVRERRGPFVNVRLFQDILGLFPHDLGDCACQGLQGRAEVAL